MKLTALRKNDLNKNEYELYVEGEYAFTISEEDYFRYYLYDKSEISLEQLDQIRYKTMFAKGVTTAIRYAVRQKRTEKQTEDYLIKKGFTEDVAHSVLHHLRKEKYLDDDDYARRYVKGRVNTTDKSLNMIIIELKHKGICEEMAEKYAYEYKEIEYDRALKVATKRFGYFNESQEIKTKLKYQKKIFSFLMYRGYDRDIIYEIINKLGYNR